MTARIIALAAASALALAVIVAKVMAVSVLAGTLLLCALIGTLVLYTAYRLIATGPGQRCAPRGFTADDERLADVRDQVIPRAVTEHAPPWEYQAPPMETGPLPEAIALWKAISAPKPEPATEVIEPAAVTPGPPGHDVPSGWVLAACFAPDGRVTSLRYDAGDEPAPAWYGSAAYTDAKIRAGMGLPRWVADELGHDSTEDAIDSMFSRAMAAQVRELTDGAS